MEFVSVVRMGKLIVNWIYGLLLLLLPTETHTQTLLLQIHWRNLNAKSPIFTVTTSWSLPKARIPGTMSKRWRSEGNGSWVKCGTFHCYIWQGIWGERLWPHRPPAPEKVLKCAWPVSLYPLAGSPLPACKILFRCSAWPVSLRLSLLIGRFPKNICYRYFWQTTPASNKP